MKSDPRGYSLSFVVGGLILHESVALAESRVASRYWRALRAGVPEKYYKYAFIDRLHTYLPGWEIDVLRGEMFATGCGFIVDYLAEVLRHLRGQGRSSDYKDLFTLDPFISTWDRDGIAPLGVEFTWAFDGTSTIHAHHLVTDAAWKILLDQGLDVFQRADLNNRFSPTNRDQRFRQVRAFEVTCLREGGDARLKAKRPASKSEPYEFAHERTTPLRKSPRPPRGRTVPHRHDGDPRLARCI